MISITEPGENIFSIIIPTWNNLPYLQFCIKSIRKNSSFNHQIIVHVNEGSDGTMEWVKSEGINYTFSEKNVGICVAVNRASLLAKSSYILYLNDDMYVCPGWDKALVQAINTKSNPSFFLSGTLIEPEESGNNAVIHSDYGLDIGSFDEKDLLENLDSLKKGDWSGATWPPNLLHKSMWEKADGLSESFSPGMYSDPDLSMKLWQEGVRDFHGVGDSLIYHFQRKSTQKITKNDGRKQFIRKWGISSRVFYRKFLNMGGDYMGPIPDKTVKPDWMDKIKRWLTFF